MDETTNSREPALSGAKCVLVVYTVEAGVYHDTTLESVHSTQAGAEAMAEKLLEGAGAWMEGNIHISAWGVDGVRVPIETKFHCW